MTQKTFDTFTTTLLNWYRKNGRALPWRKKATTTEGSSHLSAIRGGEEARREPYGGYGERRGDEDDKEGCQMCVTDYEVWVSEVMLQQTQVSRVTEFYKKFLKRFPNVSSLATTSWEEFLPYYEGLGYYNRGRNMLLTAKTVVSEFGGRFPTDKQELMKLPGIGEYTTNAILAFAYDENVLAKDTNLQRIFTRYFPEEKDERTLFKKAEEYLSKRDDVSGREFNNALMDFGSLVCVSRPNKEDHLCPFGKNCHCFQKTQLSTRTTKLEKFPTREAKAYVFLHKDHREYYSRNKKAFQPFLLPAGGTSREKIKEYFLEKYGLALSVRPPFRKTYISSVPFLLINAQILSGENPFYFHSKSSAEEFKKKVSS